MRRCYSDGPSGGQGPPGAYSAGVAGPGIAVVEAVCEGDRVGTVAEGGNRLDRALVSLFPDLSRARLQDLVRAGHVRRDGEVVRDPAL